MRARAILAAAASVAAAWAAPASAQEPAQVRAEFIGAGGEALGWAELTQAPIGVVIVARLSGLPEGAKGFHLHETGACEPPFESAGGHFNPAEANHGYFVEGGPHAGDLPNIHVPASGEVIVELFNPLVSLQDGHEASLLDEDGSALIVHAEPDDYISQPSGAAGDRIACAVIAR